MNQEVITSQRVPSPPLVTVVTATTGNPLLKRNVRSVLDQDYERIQHLVVVDGPAHTDKVNALIDELRNPNLDVLQLPYPTGTNRYNGHRIYGACTYLCEGQFIIFLDDDNSLTPTHISDCLKVIQRGNDWAFSFRNITDKDQSFICRDDCESLGKWHSIINPADFFIDVNCYFLPKQLALAISPVWFRQFRQPGQPEIDRAMFAVLNHMTKKFDTTYNYSVNYTCGNSSLSVQKEFFLQGNEKMLALHNGVLPWVRK